LLALWCGSRIDKRVVNHHKSGPFVLSLRHLPRALLPPPRPLYQFIGVKERYGRIANCVVAWTLPAASPPPRTARFPDQM
jgi:hypothetical protein